MHIYRTFCPAVDEWFQAIWIVLVDHVDEGRIDPTSRFDRVQAADNDI